MSPFTNARLNLFHAIESVLECVQFTIVRVTECCYNMKRQLSSHFIGAVRNAEMEFTSHESINMFEMYVLVRKKCNGNYS